MRRNHNNQNRNTGGNVPHVDAKYTQFLSREEMPLLDFVMKKLDGISRSKAKAILAGGGVLVDKKTQTRHDFIVQPDSLVEISKHPGGTRTRFDFSKYFTVVYEDPDVIVVEKADEVLSMGVGHNSLNMKDLLDRYFVETHQRCHAHVVHRLDTRTSGLMVYAKSIEAQQLMTADWHKTVIDRRYVAVVEGYMEKEEGHVESWLKDTPSMKIVSSRTNNGGKWASTDWRLIKQNDHFALLELHLHTGRKNQIRVHMQVLHHPIVGDYKYGSHVDGARRLCLHAFRLAFYQPTTGEALHFETPFPDYFLSFFRERRRQKK
ncbi:MAG: RluA family pseudouridine synthase [Muribaculaceae bacterium]|nr:RluA family pseudouridine synthase [Muribaculaceae bacterium]